MNRSFLILLVLVIFLGAGFGGSFVGGVIYGQSLGNETEGELSPRLGAAGQFPGGAEAADGGQRGQGRRGQGQAPAPQPQVTPEVLAAATSKANREDSSAVASAGAAPDAARISGGRGGAVGTVQALDGDMLTVASARGEVTATLSEATAIYQVSEAGREVLAEGATVRVSGARNPEGVIAAQAIVILPEGAESLFGAGSPGGRQRGQ